MESTADPAPVPSAWATDQGSHPGLTPGFHRGADRARGHPPVDPDGPRNADGVGVRGRGHLLRRPARRRSDRHGRHHRIADDDDLRRGDRDVDWRDRRGRQARRREGQGSGGAGRGAVDPARTIGRGDHRPHRRAVRTAAAGVDGSERGRAAHRLDVSARDGGRKRHGADAVPDQRRLPRRRRCRYRDARAVVRERDQHHPRTVFHLRHRSIPGTGCHRGRGRNDDRSRVWRALSAVPPHAPWWPHRDSTASTSTSISAS